MAATSRAWTLNNPKTRRPENDAYPEGGTLTIKTLTRGRKEYPRAIGAVEFLGNDGRLEFVHNENGLIIKLPKSKPNPFAYAFRIR